MTQPPAQTIAPTGISSEQWGQPDVEMIRQAMRSAGAPEDLLQKGGEAVQDALELYQQGVTEQTLADVLLAVFEHGELVLSIVPALKPFLRLGY